jgi:antitoxin VapB
MSMDSTTQLHINDPAARQLATELSQLTGETVSEAVTEALRERLERKRVVTAAPREGLDRNTTRSREGLAERLMEIGRQAASRPVIDPREPDDMLYDEFGLPK